MIAYKYFIGDIWRFPAVDPNTALTKILHAKLPAFICLALGVSIMRDATISSLKV